MILMIHFNAILQLEITVAATQRGGSFMWDLSASKMTSMALWAPRQKFLGRASMTLLFNMGAQTFATTAMAMGLSTMRVAVGALGVTQTMITKQACPKSEEMPQLP